MKKFRRSSRDMADAKEEILDSVIDYCMSEDVVREQRYTQRGPPVPTRYRGGGNLPSAGGGGAGGGCDPTSSLIMHEMLSALTVKLVVPSACGASHGFQKSRSAAHREFLYKQIDEEHSRVMDYSTSSNRRDRDIMGLSGMPKTVRKDRKPSGIMNARSASGIMNTRSEEDCEDWDMGMRTNVRDQVVPEGNEDEDDDSASAQTYIIRVRSRESLVSELTELPRRVKRENSARSDRALSGMESQSSLAPSRESRRIAVPVRPATPTRRIGPGGSLARRVGQSSKAFSVRRDMTHPLHKREEYIDNANGAPHFRVFDKEPAGDAELPDAAIQDDTTHPLQVRGVMPQ